MMGMILLIVIYVLLHWLAMRVGPYGSGRRRNR
jgi:hypothetical protein